MGRTRIPLSEQKGDLTKERQERRKAEQELVKTQKNYIKKAPVWLSKRAKKEYKRLLDNIKDMDMLGDLDANNLACYCNAFDKYLIAEEDVSERGTIIEGRENPSILLQIKFAKEMREFGKQCGLSIDSRLKFAAVKLKETEDEITDKFGDI